MIWRIIYALYPPLLRMLEKLKIHRGRQPYLVGFLKGEISALKNYLEREGFEDAILAWKDEGEILSMRKINDEIYQYHIRVFDDGEIRAHYEYSSEGNPWGHVREHHFVPKKRFFSELLEHFMK